MSGVVSDAASLYERCRWLDFSCFTGASAAHWAAPLSRPLLWAPASARLGYSTIAATTPSFQLRN
eukprot:9000282-Pyramimonas_sp.AAC.1